MTESVRVLAGTDRQSVPALAFRQRVLTGQERRTARSETAYSTRTQVGPMSVQALSWALRCSEAELGERLVIFVLADHAGQHDEYGEFHVAWPGVRTIAKHAKLNPRHVQKCLRSLEERGEITALGVSELGTTIYKIGGGGNLPGGGIRDREGGAKGATQSTRSTTTQELKKQVLAPKQRKRDLLWDALTAELGEPATKSERGRRNKALVELREIQATPEMIHERLRNYRRRWPGIEVTANALAANWTTLADSNGNGTVKLSQSERMRLLAAEREKA